MFCNFVLGIGGLFVVCDRLSLLACISVTFDVSRSMHSPRVKSQRLAKKILHSVSRFTVYTRQEMGWRAMLGWAGAIID